MILHSKVTQYNLFNISLSFQGTSSVSTNKGYINETNVKEVYLQILRGRDGRDGLPGRDGQKGERGDKGEIRESKVRKVKLE